VAVPSTAIVLVVRSSPIAFAAAAVGSVAAL
jgi:hypothetical protein